VNNIPNINEKMKVAGESELCEGGPLACPGAEASKETIENLRKQTRAIRGQ